jgi:methylase of polypeptide subunit release factors
MPDNFSPSDEALLQLGHALREFGYSFVTPTPATHQRVNARPENQNATDLRGVFGWSRPFHETILPPQIWQLMQRAEVVAPHANGWRSRVRFSTLSGQLFVHSAYPTTSADAVFFGPDTYRFALAIEHFFALNNAPRCRIADIGCGAGPGAILCALSQPHAEVFGLDINDKALRFTRINAALAGTKVVAQYSDVLKNVEDDFDLIVANPPYLVDAEERTYRHGGGPLGADLSLQIIEESLSCLAPDGTLLLYTGAAIMKGEDPFFGAAETILREKNIEWTYHEVDPDVFGEELESGVYAQADRIAAVVLTCHRRREFIV